MIEKLQGKRHHGDGWLEHPAVAITPTYIRLNKKILEHCPPGRLAIYIDLENQCITLEPDANGYLVNNGIISCRRIANKFPNAIGHAFYVSSLDGNKMEISLKTKNQTNHAEDNPDDKTD